METPAILLLIFNRPEHTRLVLDAIRKVKPKKLYISSDGPKTNNSDSAELVNKVRNMAEAVDWDCEVKTNYHKQNLGCRVAVSTGIDWFFEHEEEGIILEDDCLPDQSFFRFCTELLSYYRDDKRIMCISGDNFQQGRSVTCHSYYFSKYNHCWGWATWRRAWAHYDKDMTLWAEFKNNYGLQAWSDGSSTFIQYWERIFDKVAAGKIDSWAYRWTFSCWLNHGLTCLPNRNLVENIGFENNATHTNAVTDWQKKHLVSELQFPLSHPDIISRNYTADKFTDHTVFEIRENSSSTSFTAGKDKSRNSWLYTYLRNIYQKKRKL
jgi:hypothetical protein